MDLIAIGAEILPAICQIGHEIRARGLALQHNQVQHKAPGDVATQVDRWAEAQLKSLLLCVLPDSQFLGEESGGVGFAELQNRPTWIVDPIDGTANFARGYPQWSVSVALAIQGEPVLGVIDDPSRDELFYAMRGAGAWLQKGADSTSKTRLRCAAISDPLKATVSTVFPKPRSALMEQYLQEFEAVIRSFGQVRRSGSMALELAYVAAGRVDAFWERGMAAWDAAAGMALVQEAGARIEAMDGMPLLESQFLAAGSPAMLPELKLRLNATAAAAAKP